MIEISHFRAGDVVFKTNGLRYPEAKEEYYLKEGDIFLGYRNTSNRLFFGKDVPVEARLDLMEVLDSLMIAHC